MPLGRARQRLVHGPIDLGRIAAKGASDAYDVGHGRLEMAVFDLVDAPYVVAETFGELALGVLVLVPHRPHERTERVSFAAHADANLSLEG